MNIPSPFNLALTDRHSKGNWFFKITGTPSVTWLTSEQFSVVLNSEGRKIGDFDEQRTWEGGRGGERFSDDPTMYKDAREAGTWISGHVFPALQWNISTGYRDAEQVLPGSVSWRGVFGSTRYISRTITASATSNRTNAWIWIRRIGTPGTLTVELQSDSAGKPSGTVLKSATVTTSTVTDYLSVLQGFTWTAQAVTSGTVYHLVVYGAATDDDKSHWEVGVNARARVGFYKSSAFSGDGTATTFSMYYRLADAPITRRWWFFYQGANFCKVSDEATATLCKWDANNSVWTIVPAATHGLGQVTGRPVEVNGFVYFPQGDTVAIRTWNGTNWDSQTIANGQGCASGFCVSYSQADNCAQIVRYNNALVSGGTTTGLAVSISRANAVAAYDTDLAFRNSTRVGNSSTTITNLMSFQNSVWVFKTDEVGTWDYDRYTMLDFGVKDTPDPTNGIAAISMNAAVYFNWLYSTERAMSGMIDDVGQGYKLAPLPYGREGVDAAYCRYIGVVFVAKDAGASGTSSVLMFDTNRYGWHEFARAWASGRRIQDVYIQTVSGSRNRLWFDCGGDSCYITLPLKKANPLYDTGVTYMHEFELESSEIDMGTASKLPKYIKDVTLTSRNLNGRGITVDLDYQLDENIGETGASAWEKAGTFNESPESTVGINEGNLRKFAYRIRAHTDSNLTPPDIRGIVPNGWARSESRKIIGVECTVNDGTVNGKRQLAKDVLNWLEEVAKSAYPVDVSSKYEGLDDYTCLIAPPSMFPIRAIPESDRITFTLLVL